jgi:hypothetical protein
VGPFYALISRLEGQAARAGLPVPEYVARSLARLITDRFDVRYEESLDEVADATNR